MTVTGREWEDWGTAPATATIWTTTTTILPGGNLTVGQLDNADRETGIIALLYDVGGDAQAQFELYSARTVVPAPPSIARTKFTIVADNQVFVPVSFIAPSIFLKCLYASLGGYPLRWAYTTINGRPNNVAMQQTSPSMNSAGTVPATDEVQLFPDACWPGIFTIYLTTTATDYGVYLRTWFANTATDTLIGSDAAPLPIALDLTTPVGSWAIVVKNNDATDADYTALGIYQP